MSKLFYKAFVKGHTFLYKLTGGKIGGNMVGMKAIILVTKGRKTGKLRETPLTYAEIDSDKYIIASAGGAPKHPDWYFNLEADPNVTVYMGAEKLDTTVQILSNQEREAVWPKIIEKHKFYEDYQSKVERIVPVIKLNL